ncbi:MAG TPA: alanine--glyoxylate aminotransferase family protein [Spirochaetia bacterium]|nr:alanine--glyoxylate aminotransferase family protein [Spirochaetia bacterium]
MKPLTLMVPGPVQVSTSVLDQMAATQVPHYGEQAIGAYTTCIEKLRPLFGLRDGGNVYIFPGSGSIANEVCSATFITPGDEVIVATNGTFGQRVRDQAASYTDKVIEVRVPEGKAVTAALVEEALKAHPAARLLMAVHLETSTGVLNPIESLGAVAARYRVPFAVDAVSSFGTERIEMDKWNIAICSTATQKGLESPPGLGIVGVSKAGWDTLLQRKTTGNGWFLNLLLWKKVQEGKEIRKGVVYPLPVTMPVNNVLALRESLEEIEREGWDAHLLRHQAIARAVRTGMQRMGFQLYPEQGSCASAVTSVVNNLPIEVSELIAFLKEFVRIEISNGLFELYNKIIRIGHIGQTAEREIVIPVLFGIECFLRKKGIDIPVGSSLVGIEEI